MKPLLTANWTNLLVATFEADRKLLREYIPYQTELNDWNGKYYMSLLAFMFSKPVIAGIPSPCYRCFEEVNLRFYVRHKSRFGWRNGVVFIKEIAPAKLIGLAAKWLYHENFISLPMKHSFSTTADERKTAYYWNTGKEWNYLELVSALDHKEPDILSLESFIRDHNFAYTRQRKNQSREFEIEHPTWNIFPGISFDMKLDAGTIYGPQFSDYFLQPPCTSFLMDGSRTNVSFPVLL